MAKKNCILILMRKKNKGFTLMEVLIFVSVISLFFVTAAAITVASLRSLKTQERKILATRYAQELLEWLKGEKEADWNQFTNKASSSGTKYCFNTSPINTWPNSGVCSTYSLDNLFKREANLTSGGATQQVNVSITVEWQETGNTFKVPINAVFAIWE